MADQFGFFVHMTAGMSRDEVQNMFTRLIGRLDEIEGATLLERANCAAFGEAHLRASNPPRSLK